MKKLILSILCFAFSGCSVTLVYVEKKNCIHGNNNNPVITGSELKDNLLKQSADGNQPSLEIPLK